MAGSVNKAILVGHLGKDPVVRRTQDGRAIVSFSVATSESWRDKNSGEKREKTEWHNVVIFTEGLAKVAEQYLKKGSKVYLEGQIQTRKWQDDKGNDRYSTEVVLQGFNATLVLLGDAGGGRDRSDSNYDDREDRGAGRAAPAPSSKPPASGGGSGFDKTRDDEIPFCPEVR